MTYAQLDAQHQGIAQELFEQAEGLLEQLVAVSTSTRRAGIR